MDFPARPPPAVISSGQLLKWIFWKAKNQMSLYVPERWCTYKRNYCSTKDIPAQSEHVKG